VQKVPEEAAEFLSRTTEEVENANARTRAECRVLNCYGTEPRRAPDVNKDQRPGIPAMCRVSGGVRCRRKFGVAPAVRSCRRAGANAPPSQNNSHGRWGRLQHRPCGGTPLRAPNNLAPLRLVSKARQSHTVTGGQFLVAGQVLVFKK